MKSYEPKRNSRKSHSEKKPNTELMYAAKLNTTAQVSANKTKLILKKCCFISICKIKVNIYSVYHTGGYIPEGSIFPTSWALFLFGVTPEHRNQWNIIQITAITCIMGYLVSAGLPNPLTPMKLVLKYESVRLASANPPPSIPGTKRKREKKKPQKIFPEPWVYSLVSIICIDFYFFPQGVVEYGTTVFSAEQPKPK